MDTQDNFFPGITTIGDILSDAGYSQTLLLGSNATFGGRKLYFSEHGNYDIIDYNYAMEQGWLSTEEYPVWWGYDDQKLFEFAKNRLDVYKRQRYTACWKSAVIQRMKNRKTASAGTGITHWKQM